jgi:hypothetical protein
MNTDTIRDYFDALACGRTPTAADLDATTDEALDAAAVGIDPPNRDEVRDRLARATRVIGRYAAEGDSGRARAVARTELAAIRNTYAPAGPSGTTPDPTIAAIVDSIPR